MDHQAQTSIPARSANELRIIELEKELKAAKAHWCHYEVELDKCRAVKDRLVELGQAMVLHLKLLVK